MVEVGVDIGEFPTSKKDDIKPSDLETILVSGKLILMSMNVCTYIADSINSNWFCRTFWRVGLHQLCTCKTVAFMAKTPCNQLLLIDFAMYMLIKTSLLVVTAYSNDPVQYD